jgi:hypothetical protein
VQGLDRDPGLMDPLYYKLKSLPHGQPGEVRDGWALYKRRGAEDIVVTHGFEEIDVPFADSTEARTALGAGTFYRRRASATWELPVGVWMFRVADVPSPPATGA